jgi:monoamine oxidase
MLDVAYTAEFGREAAEQSCLNLLYFISTNTEEFSVYGESNERYTILGGNEQIVRLLANNLANSIETDTVLEAINTRPDGRYQVSLRSGYRTFSRTYERIVLTLPFSTLRFVALNVDLPPVKQKAIAQLGYGTNTKLFTGYQQKLWRTRYSSTAAMFTDTGFQNAWEASRHYPGPKGVIAQFTGGENGLALGKGSAESHAQILLPQLEQIFPGITKQRQGEAIRVYWSGEQYTQGSYSCYLVGQWTTISGSEQKRIGNLFFAGEHCSQAYQGYMEGGCRTGEVAAKRILKDLGLQFSPTVQKPPVTVYQGNQYRTIKRGQRFSDDLTEE